MKRFVKFLTEGRVTPALVFCLLVTAMMSTVVYAAQGLNELSGLVVDNNTGKATVTMTTKAPVGYRYTVYDSFDPVRVVVDFPGMDTSALDQVQSFNVAPISQVRVSSFDLESGTLGRVEILLDKATNYEVSLDANKFQVVFAEPKPVTPSLGEKLEQTTPEDQPAVATETKIDTQTKEAVAPQTVQAESAAAEVPVEKAATVKKEQGVAEPSAVEPAPLLVPAPAVVATQENFTSAATTSSDTLIDKPIISSGSAVISADGKIGRHQYFSLGAPPRLVVDIYGAKPDFKERAFDGNNGIKKLRIGTYSDKTRLVFDAESDQLPDYQVKGDDSTVSVSWAQAAGAAVVKPENTAMVPAQQNVPATVEALDFNSEGGNSIFTVSLSQPSELIPANLTDDIIRFGIKNALISQKLRRTVDASAFPSAVKLITPYTVQTGDSQEVRFAVELKGPVSYEMGQDSSKIVLTVNDGPFAEPRQTQTENKEIVLNSDFPDTHNKFAESENVVQVSNSQLEDKLNETAEAVQMQSDSPDETTESQSVISTSQGSYRIAEQKSGYTGEKISLVFDNADIRKILQLIADVSNLNIIASEEVKGSITLRLKEVPWDQALDLIMDIQDLGMVHEGNVARIMPRDRIRSMEESKLNAKRTREKLEDLVTEVISISYTDLRNVESPAKELLTDRGKITKDDRNKQIIVTDIPSVISDIKNLVKILDTPERQVMIEARIVEADSSFSRDLGVNWGITNRDTAAAADVSQELRLGVGGAFLLSPPVAGGSGGSGLASSMTFGQLGTDTTILDLRISALETSGHGKIISTPRVTTLNGEKAKISQGTQIPYVVQSDSGPNTEFVEAALSLEVVPVINPDGSIILKIKATNSSPGATVSTGVTGGEAPSIDTKEAETKLLVQDGETTVLGGIFVEGEDYSETGVPWINNIPILGHLFKSTKNTSSRSELLVFITPRILQ